MEKELQEIGLTEQEAKVYLQLLKQKYKEASKIAKETKINRSVAYSILESLTDKGLVSHIIKNNIKCFKAADPKTLMDFLKDKEKTLQNILPKLSDIKAEEKEAVTVELYQGIKGSIAVLKDIIRTKKDYVAFGDEGIFQEILRGTIAKQYVRQLNEINIKERLITREGTKLVGSTKFTEIKYLPKEFRFPTITAIYGDKVAIAIFDKPYYVILIKSKTLAFAYQTLFEGLWKIAKK